MKQIVKSVKGGDIPLLVVSVVIPLAAGLVGSVLTSQSIADWYPSLVKPSVTPPNWVFGPVWTTLYILMGISLFLVWRQIRISRTSMSRDGQAARETNLRVKEKLPPKELRTIAIFTFATQLALNILWSGLFFGLRSPSVAFVEIIFLWAAIAATIGIFARISRLAALLLLPYLAWTTLAMTLNLQIWILNP